MFTSIYYIKKLEKDERLFLGYVQIAPSKKKNPYYRIADTVIWISSIKFRFFAFSKRTTNHDVGGVNYTTASIDAVVFKR